MDQPCLTVCFQSDHDHRAPTHIIQCNLFAENDVRILNRRNNQGHQSLILEIVADIAHHFLIVRITQRAKYDDNRDICIDARYSTFNNGLNNATFGDASTTCIVQNFNGSWHAIALLCHRSNLCIMRMLFFCPSFESIDSITGHPLLRQS